jgi:hypothetical protein
MAPGDNLCHSSSFDQMGATDQKVSSFRSQHLPFKLRATPRSAAVAGLKDNSRSNTSS